MALKAYLDHVRPRLNKIGEPEARSFAEDETLETLPKLDGTLWRKLLEFLGENDLLTGPTPIRLRGADFRRVDLRGSRLSRADLSGVSRSEANLSMAILFEVKFRKARLLWADHGQANLQGADLRQSDLTGAFLGKENLATAALGGAKVTPKEIEDARTK